MLKKNCALFLAIMMVVTMLVGPLSVCAVNTTPVAPISGNVSGHSTGNTVVKWSEESDTGVESVTMDELTEKIEKKGDMLIKALQVLGGVICILGFIFGAFQLLFGALGLAKGGLLSGSISLVIAGLSAAFVRYAPELVEFIVQFAAA